MKEPLASIAYGLPPTAGSVVAGVIFVATLVLIMLRPRKLNEALAALGGAIAMLLALSPRCKRSKRCSAIGISSSSSWA